MSKGEYRVGVDFNPSGNPAVAEVKALAAKLIDAIEDLRPELRWLSSTYAAEVARLKAHAQTLIEDGCRAAVAAATKPDTKKE